MGGKNLEGVGGKEPDFLLQNALTGHVMIVEIKTPATPLLSRSAYRPPDCSRLAEKCAVVGQIGRYRTSSCIAIRNSIERPREVSAR